jgi:DNA replication protein DnaC
MMTAPACTRCGAPIAAAVTDGVSWCTPCSDEIDRESKAGQQERARKDLERKVTVLPAALRDRSLDDLDDTGLTRVIAEARRWANGEFPGLMLVGPFGVGKTTVTAAAARDRMAAGRPAVRWVSVPLATTRLAGPFGDTERQKVLDKLTSTHGALILDDIDKARPTVAVAEILFAAIDQAITEGLPLAITTNLKPAALAERWPQPFGPGIASRLVGYCETFALTGPDRRLA